MNFTFYSALTFEPWDWRTPLETGIGGSETSHVEMAQRLARRGHSIASFAPLPDLEAIIDPAGAVWSDVQFFESHFRGVRVFDTEIAVIYRDPGAVEKVPEGVPAWLICQDIEYPTLTPERAARFTRIVALCSDHAAHLKRRYPFAAEKVFISSNGIRSELIMRMIDSANHPDGPVRNPKRLMYASSPDRGLANLLSIFERVKEIIPEVELHVFYGFNNLKKVEERAKETAFGGWLKAKNEALVEKMRELGVVHHERVGQRDMVDEWLKSGIWCHPSEFTETSCITCMDAQACGAIPVTTPIWAIWENVQHGIMIEGAAETDPLVKARYVNELVKLVQDPERQDDIRRKMQPWALKQFDWENFVTQWEGWAAEDLATAKRGKAA